jgi:regulator of cell morphogenesis and NO signaling
MNKQFSISNIIGEIVAEFPGATDIFYKYNIDFCCGGDRKLEVALDEENLGQEMIVTQLNKNYNEFLEQKEEFTDWVKESPTKLINYIINTHHQYLKEELPTISAYLFKILKVHGKGHEELFEIHKLYNSLRTELEGHLVKEEEFIFPLIKEYQITKDEKLKLRIIKGINELEEEHTGAGDIIKELREVTNHYTAPKDGCNTYNISFSKLMELEKDLFQHIHLENNILFKNL